MGTQFGQRNGNNYGSGRGLSPHCNGNPFLLLPLTSSAFCRPPSPPPPNVARAPPLSISRSPFSSPGIPCVLTPNFIGLVQDTEFPGIVARPVGPFSNPNEYHYKLLKCNVDLLKVIQLGFCFCDENGNLPEGVCVWQFNFKFDLSKDMFAQDSIEFLKSRALISSGTRLRASM